MLRFVLKTVLFALLLLIINVQGERVMYYGWEAPEYFRKFDEYRIFYQQTTNTLFFGSSRTLRHVDPIAFDSLNALQHIHTETYNMAGSAILFNEQFHLFQEFFRDSSSLDHLKYIFLELDDEVFILKDYLYTTRFSHYITISDLGRLLSQIFAANETPTEKIAQAYYHLTSMIRHHMFMGQGVDRLKRLLYKRPQAPLAPGVLRGFRPASTTNVEYQQSQDLQQRRSLFLKDTMIIHRAFKALDSLHQQTIDSKLYNPLVYRRYMTFLTKMKAKGVHVILLLPMRGYVSPRLLSLYKALPEGYKIDMGGLPEAHVLNSAQYWFDPGHLNVDGARINTRLLAEAFQAMLATEKE